MEGVVQLLRHVNDLDPGDDTAPSFFQIPTQEYTSHRADLALLQVWVKIAEKSGEGLTLSQNGMGQQTYATLRYDFNIHAH